MSEFNDRIAAQRNLLQLVNSRKWGKEELCGLSRGAIDRWSRINGIDPESALVGLVRNAGSKLFFLANKSQEQVSGEYRAVATEIAAIARAIQAEVEQCH